MECLSGKISMFVKRGLIALLCSSPLSICGQPDTAFFKKQMLEEAEKMGQSIQERRYDDFVQFLYPPTVEFLGGEAKIAEAISVGFQGSYNIDTITYFGAGPILTEGTMSQCVFVQTIVVRIKQGTVSSKSAVIGFNEKKSSKWYFIDTDGRKLEDLRKKYPFLSKELNLPVMPDPKFTPNDEL